MATMRVFWRRGRPNSSVASLPVVGIPVERNNDLLLINGLHLFLYLCQAVTVGIGAFGLGSVAPISEISQKYPTLVTPASWVAPTVWILLLLAQAVWAIAQVCQKYRNCALVTQGVRYYYSGVCLAQIIWIVTFSYQLVYISLFAGLANMAFLMLIHYDSSNLPPPKTLQDVCIHTLPFSLFTGWIICTIIWNISIVLVDYSIEADIQYYVAMMSLVALGLASSMCLMTDYVIPLVIFFVTIGVMVELGNPSAEIRATFPDEQIMTVQTTSIIVFTVILVATFARLLFQFSFHKRAASSMGGYGADDETVILSSENSFDDDVDVPVSQQQQ